MELKIFQKGFNYSQDGPGNRLVYHLQGCNLFCPWCANPEGIKIKGCLVQNKSVLNDAHCPNGGIVKGELLPEKCNNCNSLNCLDFLDSGLKLSCQSYSVDDVVKEVQNSKLMFFEGGGVTFTGGEATLQFDPLKETLNRLKLIGINTAIETNGTIEKLDELFPLTDHLIMDIKHYDKQKFATLGGNLETVISNIKKAKNQGVHILLRIPLVNGFNAEISDAYGFAELLKSLNIDNIELLRYHEFGKEKWKKCGMEYTVENGFVDDERFKEIAKILKENNIKIIHT